MHNASIGMHLNGLISADNDDDDYDEVHNEIMQITTHTQKPHTLTLGSISLSIGGER